MTTPNSFSPQRTPTAAAPIEQLFVMHCLKEDSVLGQEGFSVRAASPGASDPAIFEWALKLDYYELPLDMKTGSLLVNQAPRRLARVPGPAGPRRSGPHSLSSPGHRRSIPQLHLADPAASGAIEPRRGRRMGIVRLADHRVHPRRDQGAARRLTACRGAR